jgi:hypothetical protein
VQLVSDTFCAYHPGVQATHALVTASRYSPLWQGWHCTAPSALAEPSSQVTQAVIPGSDACVPDSHGEQTGMGVWPPIFCDERPGGHNAQEIAPLLPSG